MRRTLVTALLAVAVLQLDAAAPVLLRNDWISRHKNRVTMIADFKIDHAHDNPNTISSKGNDGDLHMSGRSEQVGLPMVAEIVNGRLEGMDAIVTDVNSKEGTRQTVPVRGIWRLWWEHPSAQDRMVQGARVPIPEDTNPKHVFELHPLTKFGNTDLLHTFRPIKGYKASDARTAFEEYENKTFTVNRGATFTSIVSTKSAFNYAEFVLEVEGTALTVEDGGFVLASVFDLEKHPLVEDPRRMVFVKDSRPAQLLTKSKVGQRFRAIGIPRLNLDALMHEARTNEDIPVIGCYEIIILGIFEN